MPLAWPLALIVAAAPTPPLPEGVVVDLVQPGLPGHQAGLAPGDVLLSWSRDGTSPPGEAPPTGRCAPPSR